MQPPLRSVPVPSQVGCRLNTAAARRGGIEGRTGSIWMTGLALWLYHVSVCDTTD